MLGVFVRVADGVFVGVVVFVGVTVGVGVVVCVIDVYAPFGCFDWLILMLCWAFSVIDVYAPFGCFD